MAEAIKLAPESPDVFAARARIYEREGGWEYGRYGQTKDADTPWKAAVADCSRAIQLSPNDGRLFAQRGAIRVQLGQIDEAISDYVKAMLLTKELRSRASFMRMRGALSFVRFVSRESQWRYTTGAPKGNWQDPDDFDDSDWKTGQAPFGWDARTPRPATEWGRGDTDEIWMRHTFELDQQVNAPLVLDIYSDDFADVYINGVQVPRIRNQDSYHTVYCPPEAKLRLGRNVVAVYCGNKRGYGKVDVSLRSQENEAAVEEILAQVIEARPDIEEFQQRRSEWKADRESWQAGAAATP
jgi:hypothetical protein